MELTGDPFTGICISNVAMTMNLKENKLPWNCTNIAGVTSKVTPKPCASLPEKQGVNCASPQKIEIVMRERERERERESEREREREREIGHNDGRGR